MKHNTETLISENNIELLVSYLWEKSDSQIEYCHGEKEVGNLVYTELMNVEVVIAGRSIEILPMLTESQKENIIELLQCEN